ncbi:hypothetical protein DFH09DRAFT_1098660 [Mycena vulgaris]|nr:hypothetical protein DFH09DRAFT_1098660 [Mycena vulgaris]
MITSRIALWVMYDRRTWEWGLFPLWDPSHSVTYITCLLSHDYQRVGEQAFAYAQKWLREFVHNAKDTQGWTVDRANILLNAAFASEAPPGMHPPEKDFLLRHPALPWQYTVSDWRHPEMKDLRREQGSAIQKMLDSGRNLRDAPRNPNKVVENSNPFTKAIRSSANTSTPVLPSLPPVPTMTADFISGPIIASNAPTINQSHASPVKPKRKSKTRRAPQLSHFPPGTLSPTTTFAQSQHPITFNAPFSGPAMTPQFVSNAGYMSEQDIQHMMSSTPFMGVSASTTGSSHDSSTYPPPTYSAVPQSTYSADLDLDHDYNHDYYQGETNTYGGMHI